jgi:CNT family concentrative nucleoside transporter
MDLLRGLMGMGSLLLVAYIFSMNRSAIKLRVVGAAFLTQLGIGALILFWDKGRNALEMAANAVNLVLGYGRAGGQFLFGSLVDFGRMGKAFGGDGAFVFAFQVLPAIIFVTSLMSVLYYLGIMGWVIRILGTLMQKLIGVSKVESFNAVANIFLGGSEVIPALRPFLNQLKGPHLFCIMTSGMAAVAGSVLAGYAGLGVKMEYLLAACAMSVPAGLLFAKIMCPTTEEVDFTFKDLQFEEKKPANVIEAAASGASIGLQIALSVGAMLIAFIALIALCNGLIGGIMGLFGHPEWNLNFLMGHALAPFAWLIGIPWADAAVAGDFIGQKLLLNEFVAYVNFSPYLKDAAALSAAGLTALQPTTLVIISFALCGFANFSSVGIMLGSFTVIAPERRSEVAKMGLRVVLASSLANLMSATMAGLFLG